MSEKETIARPAFIDHRINLFEKFAIEFREAQASEPRKDITIKFGDKETVGQSFETTPFQAATAAKVDKKLLKGAVCAIVRDSNGDPMGLVNGQWDMERPLEADCSIELRDFSSPEGQAAFWHSSAHILGHAMELVYGGWLTIGPPVEDGFYYDMYTGEGACGKPRSASEEDFPAIQAAVAAQIGKKGHGMCTRIEVTKDQALEMFGYNKFKVEMINELMAAGTTTTVYRVGDFVDLCRGPHMPTSKSIVAMQCTKLGAAYWRGSADNESLQRVYGISFPDKPRMTAWKLRMEEAKKRDHRALGLKQSLFFFNPISPGSCFFLPHGARLYNTLINFIKQQYWLRGYDEVITPNMFSLDLWEISGHAAKYKDDMFLLDVEKQTFGLKPMNCPGHCIMFRERSRSYRELPMRFADFGVLHRNELSGALSGLTRVRRFQQDDAHIFCTAEQVSKEVLEVLRFVEYVYDIFGMTFNLMLSTRPPTYLGEISMWDAAEASLAKALDEFCGDTRKQGIDPGGGAFYGPKIDIQVTDALGRPHQCATVQLDFQLPLRFDLNYQGPPTSDGAAGTAQRPVIIHRAILGSVERMIAVLTEHYGGKWPFWMSPRQIIVIPISKEHLSYAATVADRFKSCGFYCDVETRNLTVNKAVREAQVAQYNYFLCVGGQEVENGTVTVRVRNQPKNERPQTKPVDVVIQEFVAQVRNHK